MILPAPAGSITVERLGLRIDSNSFVPYYMQIVDQVRELIKKNKLSQGQIFCSEGEIAHALNISKMPVRQAFPEVAVRRTARNHRQRIKRPVVGSVECPGIFNSFVASAKRCGGVALHAIRAPARYGIGRSRVGSGTGSAQLTPGERVYRMRRLRLVNEDPVAVVTSYLPARIFARNRQAGFGETIAVRHSKTATSAGCNGQKK